MTKLGRSRSLRVKPSVTVGQDVYPVVFDGSWVKAGTTDFLTLYPKVVIVPVYHKIRVTFLDVQIWLIRLNNAVFQLLQSPGTSLDLEWDISLQTTNGYKKILKRSLIAKDRIEQLLLFQHPRFIWRVLLRVGGVSALELLVDATDMARSLPIYQAVWLNQAVYAPVFQLLNEPALENTMIEYLTKRFYKFLKTVPAP